MFELMRYLIEAIFISFQKTDQNVIFLFSIFSAKFIYVSKIF